VVNDRWQTDSLFRRLMGLRPARGSFDLFFKQVIARDPGVVDTITPPAVPRADFTTREYAQYPTTQQRAWETTRGMGTSYGYTPPPSRSRSGRSGDEASRVATGGQAGSSNRCGP
jgi:hypothetical protein